jgi:hypothetical protein
VGDREQNFKDINPPAAWPTISSVFFFLFSFSCKTNETLNRWEIGILWNPFELKKIFAHVKSQSKISHEDAKLSLI